MAKDSQFEIPKALQDMAQQNVEKAREAYDQFVEATRQAQLAMSQSQGVASSSTQELQKKAINYAQTNVDVNFEFATELANAKDPTEILQLQQDYLRRQMQNNIEQAQEFSNSDANY